MKKIIFTFLCVICIGGLTSQNVTVFSDSPDNEKYPSSWGQQNVTLINTNIPVTTVYKNTGTNALDFRYREGFWQVHIFNRMNVAVATNLEFWIYSPAEVPANMLPSIYLTQENNATSSTLSIGNYGGALPAGNWRKVTIPIDAFKAGSSINFADIKAVSFGQNFWTGGITYNANVVIDDIVITGIPTGIDKVASSNLKVNYTNGLLSVTDYTGEVYLYDITGKVVNKVDMVKGVAAVNLTKGVYIVKIVEGAAKLIVK